MCPAALSSADRTPDRRRRRLSTCANAIHCGRGASTATKQGEMSSTMALTSETVECGRSFLPLTGVTVRLSHVFLMSVTASWVGVATRSTAEAVETL